MRPGVLGPLLVVDDAGVHVPVPASRLRVLFAALLLYTNTPALCRQTDTAVRERRWAQASRAAELAASLWRGPVLSDVPCRVLHDEFAPRFEQPGNLELAAWCAGGWRSAW